MAFPISVPGVPPPYFHRTIATIPRNPGAPIVSVRRVRFIDPQTGTIQAAAPGMVGPVPVVILFN